MELLFNKSAIRIGIDTIKIKISRNLFQSEPTNQLINKLKSALDPDEILLYQKKKKHFLKHIVSNRTISKIYKTGDYSCMIELFGMCQTITNFKLTEHHATILSVIGNMTDMEMTLEKIDVAQDFFYPHDRSFVFDDSKKQKPYFLDLLNYQSRYPFVHLTEIPMHTIRVPKNRKDMIRFAFNHPKIKSSTDKKHGDCYYRWVKLTSHFLNKVNYGECDIEESSHFEIKINDRKILCRISDFFDGTETFGSDYDHENEINIKNGTKKVSNIKYDKSKKDKEKYGCMNNAYQAIIKEIADTNDEYNDLMKHFQHTRVESRFFKPCVTSTQKKPLDINLESSYDKLFNEIKKEIGKMTIFILKPDTDISIDDYVDSYKKRLEKVNATRAITSSDYGKILEVTSDRWNDFENQINFLKSKFIPDVTPSISDNPARRIIQSLPRGRKKNR